MKHTLVEITVTGGDLHGTESHWRCSCGASGFAYRDRPIQNLRTKAEDRFKEHAAHAKEKD